MINGHYIDAPRAYDNGVIRDRFNLAGTSFLAEAKTYPKGSPERLELTYAGVLHLAAAKARHFTSEGKVRAPGFTAKAED